MKASTYRLLVNLWPPFLFNGIRVKRIAPDFRAVDVCLHDLRFNRNGLGVHFGGTLFTMADAFYVIMLGRILGPGYQVWDKKAAIDFKVPGRGTLTTSFVITDEALDEIRLRLSKQSKMLKDFTVTIVDAEGAVVATVEKTVYVRRPFVHRKRGAASAASQDAAS